MLLLVASGFRLTELTTLPADCLVDQRGLVGLRYFSVKKGKFEIKPVASAFGPSIRAAVDHLQKFTASGRAAALKASDTKWTGSAQYDWSYILRNGEATAYFVGRQLHAWTANPRNNMFNPAGAWFERDKTYVDVLQMLRDANGNHSEVARRLNTSSQAVVYLTWAQEAMQRGELPPNSQRNSAKLNHVMDSRYITHSVLERLMGMKVKERRLKIVQPYLREAQRLQLLGEVYPEPPYDARLETMYARQYPAVVYSSDGKRLLEPHEALFVVEERALSHSQKVKVGEFTVVPANRLTHWLTGEAKVRGTGSVTDSVFVRFGIKDPRTGQIAKFTSHDVRHWLNTMYLRGGLSSVEAALVMGHDPTVNATYDQRDFLEREAALKQAVREHRAIGHIPETYEALFREDVAAAEEYLISVLRRYTLMPHGACSRNLRQDPCPNQLSCFADQHREDGGACMYLIVDAQAPGLLSNLQALERQQDTLLTVLPASSPQAVHALWTRRNVQAFIERLEK